MLRCEDCGIEINKGKGNLYPLNPPKEWVGFEPVNIALCDRCYTIAVNQQISEDMYDMHNWREEDER